MACVYGQPPISNCKNVSQNPLAHNGVDRAAHSLGSTSSNNNNTASLFNTTYEANIVMLSTVNSISRIHFVRRQYPEDVPSGQNKLGSAKIYYTQHETVLSHASNEKSTDLLTGECVRDGLSLSHSFSAYRANKGFQINEDQMKDQSPKQTILHDKSKPISSVSLNNYSPDVEGVSFSILPTCVLRFQSRNKSTAVPIRALLDNCSWERANET